MRSVLLGSLRAHTRRYVAAVLAVTIAVGFVVVTNALASAAKDGLSAGVDDAYPGADLVVADEYGAGDEDAAAALDVARAEGDEATVVASAWTRVTSDGRSLGNEVRVSTVADRPDLRRQTVTAGRAPAAPDEALLKESVATSSGLGLGDELTLGSGSHTEQVRVVGLAEGATYLDADVHVPWATMQTLTHSVDSVVYAVTDPDAVTARAETLGDAVASEVRPRDDHVDAQVLVLNQGVDVISYVLLLFAGIAGFVAVLVITNTFTILFAQRTRDLALLRCVGATRRQLLRSVRLESLVLGVAAAATGVFVGAAAGYSLAAAARAVAGERVGTVDLSPTWLAAAFVGGALTTLVAAWWPTRAVTRVSPLDALRPAGDDGVRSRAGRLRVATGIVLAGGGAAVLALAVATEQVPVLMAGGMASFLGVLVLGPVIVPALLRLVGRLAPGASARLAGANARRNPRRSAATTASLLVGVTLTTAVLTGMASARGAIDTEMDADHPVDASLVGTDTISPRLADDVRAVEGVEGVTSVPGVVASMGPVDTVTVLGPTSVERDATRDASSVRAGEGEVLVPSALWSDVEDGLPDEVVLSADGRETTVRTRLVTAEWGDAVVVSPDTLAAIGGGTGSLALWLDAADGTDPDELAGALGGIARDHDLEVASSLENRAWVDLQLDVLVWAVLGLLGVAVLIALVGIANTVGLSVLERGREHALLRALGLTRGQLRRVLAAEGLLLALVAAIVGTGLGVAYGWLGVLTVVRPVVPAVTLELPWLQLLGVLVAAGAAGLLACVLPARRASRTSPAEGLTLD